MLEMKEKEFQIRSVFNFFTSNTLEQKFDVALYEHELYFFPANKEEHEGAIAYFLNIEFASYEVIRDI
jgi:hypothetical protein